MVVKGTYGPEEVHDTTKEAVKRAEKAEQERRVAEVKISSMFCIIFTSF
jgi:hypothetical protein